MAFGADADEIAERVARSVTATSHHTSEKVKARSFKQDKLAEAEALYREALAGRRKVLGDEHPETLESVRSLAGVLREQGKLDEAEPVYREALEGRRKVLGDAHPLTLESLKDMVKFRTAMKERGGASSTATHKMFAPC